MASAKNMIPPELITAKEVERITSIPVGTLARWRCRGIGFPWIKFPEGSVRYDRREVIAYTDKCRRSPSVRAHMEEIVHGGV